MGLLSWKGGHSLELIDKRLAGMEVDLEGLTKFNEFSHPFIHLALH
jgi:hypothetical protein